MRKLRYILLGFLCAVGMAACQDDLIENPSVNGADINKPVKVDLKFGIPKSMEVEVSRADNTYSTINTLRLYVFNENSLMGQPQSFSINANTITDEGVIDTEGHFYRVNATLYQGTQTVYAIANASTQIYWQNPTEALDAAAAQGKEAFLETVYDLYSGLLDNNFLPTLTQEAIPLSGKGEVTVTGDETNPSVSGRVVLQRPTAKIVFDIEEKSTTNEGNNVTFTPQYYGVYKVAGRSYVFADEAGRTAIDDTYYYNTPNDQPITRLENGIFVPENIQTSTACTTYDDRDEVDPEQVGATDAEKSWINAPKNATYIVIKGTYVETDGSTGNLVRQADVSYTIHLGDWSNNNFNDFSVLRNYIYTYRMTVKGVDKIVVEATAKEDSDEFQDAAEGDVIDVTRGSEVFNLDAHYEQVYVEYDLTEIANQVTEKLQEEGNTERIEDLIANSFILSIHTPMNLAGASDELLRPYLGNDETGETSMGNLDWKWIEFYSQTSEDEISTYTTAKNDEDYPILNPWQACRKMGQAVYELTQNSSTPPVVDGLQIASSWENSQRHYIARFTIFVDEFFYTHDLENNPVDWADFTRIDPRTFMIATDIQVSPDANSSYATARTYISQASILTFYNRDSADDTNALGIESYNEYGIIAGFGEVDEHSYISGEDYLSNGRHNMLRNTSSSRSAQSSYNGINFAHIGYTASNATSGHSWSELTQNEKSDAAYKACLSRNRDLNGNGQIDDDEVHWYLPSRSQYLRMGIGANSLGDYQLYMGEKSEMNYGDYPVEYADDGALYYSNTPNGNNSDAASWELYWAVEVGAYGSNSYGDATSGNNNRADNGAQIRCVRNLPSLAHVTANDDPNGDEALAGPVYNELKQLPSNMGGNYIFDFGNRLDGTLYRTTVQEGPYASHTEIDDANMLPGAFVVANESLRGNYIEQGHWEWQDREQVWVDESYYKGLTVSSAWSGGNDNPCATYSEKEDRSDRGEWRVPNLSELMVMSTVDATIGIRNNVYLCSTQFSNPSVRSGFRYNSTLIAAWDPNSGGQRGYVRCVRDATQTEIDEVRSE